MNSFTEDSDDSALISMTVTQKRKASDKNDNRKSKQLKLPFSKLSANNDASSKELCEVSTENPTNYNETNQQEYNELKNENNFSKWNESRSSYFSNKNKSFNNCPLCFKSFETELSYATHIKKCGKKHKLTTQQLLSALELQKKHLKERKALGLSSQILPTIKKAALKKDAKEDPSYDLELGLALSKSLNENKPKSIGTENSTETQKSSLQKFRLAFSNSIAGTSKKKSKPIKNSILRVRTKEERQQIITEKAAVVLLDEDLQESLISKNVDYIYLSQHDLLKKYYSRDSRLWNLGENDMNFGWYVEEIKSLIMTDNKLVKGTTSVPLTPSDNIDGEILKLNLPRSNINEGWRKMINNNKLSDVVGRSKDSHNFYLHSLILYVRCPDILEKDYGAIFEKFNMSTILIFCEYLYCGTINGCKRSEINNLLNLALDFKYQELIDVLNCLKNNLNQAENEELSSITPDLGKLIECEPKLTEQNCEPEEVEVVSIVSNEGDQAAIYEDKDIFVDDMVDLTQSSHGSSTVNDDSESDVEKSIWKFLEHNKEIDEMEEKRRQEEEIENTIISSEMEKIETSIKEQHEKMQQILNEFEQEESNIKNKLELEKIYQLQRRESDDSATKDFDDDYFNNMKKEMKITDDCIILSSDSDTRMSKTDDCAEEKKEVRVFIPDYEIPQFDAYDNYCNFSNLSPKDIQENPSQSLLTGDISPISSLLKNESNLKSTPEVSGDPKENIRKGPDIFSTPISNRRTALIRSSLKKSLGKEKKRKSDLSASRIIRKSLSLSLKKPRNSKSTSIKKSRRKNSKKGKDLTEALTNSVLSELSKSPMLSKLASPLQEKRFVELTPLSGKGTEFTESITPSPNYSNMGDSVLKEHLSKYGLKRSLAKSKAKKILRHIYEELHPMINTETGKIVKMLPQESSKTRKKGQRQTTKRKRQTKETKNSKTGQEKKKSPAQRASGGSGSSNNSSKVSNIGSEESFNATDLSTDYDSDRNDFEDVVEPLTQSLPNNPIDLPSALTEYLQINPEYHKKILLYEPIWLEDLQANLKETFQKHFKLSDLMDYLDQKCITFRSQAQKRNNQKKNEKKRNSPRKKKNSSS